MEIKKAGAPQTGRGDWFTGIAILENYKQPGKDNNLAIGKVTFSPGSRTFWHSHPFGQTLIVTEGIGLVGRRGEPARQITLGDIVIIEPDEQHWHGGCPDSSMSHIHVNGVADEELYATFYEAVSDEDYYPELPSTKA